MQFLIKFHVIFWIISRNFEINFKFLSILIVKKISLSF